MADRKICCTCLRRIESDNAPVLTMGAYGNPKLLCDDCSSLIENITRGTDYEAIKSDMQTLTERMSSSNVDDRFTMECVTELLSESAVRAQQIKDGTYDFALDAAADSEGFDEIPEELMETEEDRKLDEEEAAANAKLDKILNWAWVGVAVAVVGFIIYKIVTALIK